VAAGRKRQALPASLHMQRRIGCPPESDCRNYHKTWIRSFTYKSVRQADLHLSDRRILSASV